MRGGAFCVRECIGVTFFIADENTARVFRPLSAPEGANIAS